MILFDTNVFIEVFKGNADAKRVYEQVLPSEICLSSITAMELYYGALNKRELLFIKKFIGCFSVIYVNESVSELALNLVELYSKSHTLDIPDALIAATAIENGCDLFTYNTKDFKYIPELHLHEG